jgi:hypothetical protein
MSQPAKYCYCVACEDHLNGCETLYDVADSVEEMEKFISLLWDGAYGYAVVDLKYVFEISDCFPQEKLNKIMENAQILRQQYLKNQELKKQKEIEALKIKSQESRRKLYLELKAEFEAIDD